MLEEEFNGWDTTSIFNLVNDVLIEDDNWHENKNDFDREELINFALNFLKNISKEEFKEIKDTYL